MPTQDQKPVRLPRLESDERTLHDWYWALPLEHLFQWLAFEEIRLATRIPRQRLRVALMRQGWTRRIDRTHHVELWHPPQWADDDFEQLQYYR